MNQPRRPQNQPRGRVRMSAPAADRLAAVGHPRRRSRQALFAFALVLALFAAQLLRVQWFDAARLQHKALAQRLTRVELPAPRGEIVDSSGATLARSLERRDVVGDPVAAASYRQYDSKAAASERGIAGVSAAIASALGGDADEIAKAFEKAAARKSRFVYLAKDVTPAQWSKIRVLGLPGVGSELKQKREYPQGTSMASLIGWVNQAGQAGGGIEQMMNSALKGKDGVHQIERARDGSEIATGDTLDDQPVAGRNVQLTIDSDLQFYAANELAAGVKSAKAESGEVVISDKQGNILAAASYPSFDNNDMSTASSSALQNRAFTAAYEPGSTQKMVTVGALLQEGIAKPTDHVEVPSTLSRAGRPFKDAESHGTEYLTLAGVIAKSSNMGTILAGEKLPKEKLYQYMRKFGLGQDPGLGYPGESSGSVPPVANWKGDTWYTIMFGQGMSSSPMQQVGEFQAIANGGTRVPLKLISAVQNGDGTMEKYTDSRQSVSVFSQAVSKELIGMMQGVVTKDGSAPKAAVPNYNVAGKTSTAQIYDTTKKRYDGVSAGFIGLAPAENPQLIISVNIQKPTAGTFGGDVAAPIFSKVMGYALQHRRIPPSKSMKLPYPITYRTEEKSSK